MAGAVHVGSPPSRRTTTSGINLYMPDESARDARPGTRRYPENSPACSGGASSSICQTLLLGTKAQEPREPLIACYKQPLRNVT